MAGPVTGRGANRWALCGVALVILALGLLLHPWRGFAHDSMLYTLFAMARLYPQSLTHDFFVRYGMQDHYTVFSPLYAAAIRLWGVDHGSALLVLLTQGAFFGAAWLLIRQLTTADRAVLGMGLLVILPSWYGAEQTFSYTELFLTPRQPAEAFALLGIGFSLAQRRIATVVCMAASALLHPIMAGAGILCWIIFEVGLPHPRSALLGGTGITVVCVLIALLPHGPLPHFDRDWLHALQARLAFMFPTRWSARDWSSSLPGLATLVAGAVLSAQPLARRLCIAALATALAGLVLSAIGSDLMHVMLATQLQMWRWLWLSGVLSALLLPAILPDAWRRGAPGRIIALLLAALWLWLSFTTAAAERASLVAQLLPAQPAGSHLAARISQARALASYTPLCIGLLLLLWLAALYATRQTALLLAALGVTAVVAVMPYAVAAWTRTQYPGDATAAYEPWRRVIPDDAEVLWPDSPPLDLWYSLHRANYWSLVQMAGSVFSRREWEIGMQRQGAVLHLTPFLGGEYDGVTPGNMAALSPQATLSALCAIPDLQYLASWRDLGPTPYPVLVRMRPLTNFPASLRLYHCRHDQH